MLIVDLSRINLRRLEKRKAEQRDIEDFLHAREKWRHEEDRKRQEEDRKVKEFIKVVEQRAERRKQEKLELEKRKNHVYEQVKEVGLKRVYD
jgi:seryl-tRNA synthetase